MSTSPTNKQSPPPGGPVANVSIESVLGVKEKTLWQTLVGTFPITSERLIPYVEKAIREAKLHTRCGMGPCQGRICGAAGEFLLGWTTPTPRPPLFPVEVATLAGAAERAPMGED